MIPSRINNVIPDITTRYNMEKSITPRYAKCRSFEEMVTMTDVLRPHTNVMDMAYNDTGTDRTHINISKFSNVSFEYFSLDRYKKYTY